MHRYSVNICRILILQKYWGLTERRIPLKPVLGGVNFFALSISSHEQTQKSAVFLYSMFSLLLTDPFFQIIYFIIN